MRWAVSVMLAAALVAACGSDEDGGGGATTQPAEPSYEEVKAAALATPGIKAKCEDVEETEDIPDLYEEDLPPHRRTAALYCRNGGLVFDYVEFASEEDAADAIDARGLDELGPGQKTKYYSYFVNGRVVVNPGAPDFPGGGDPFPGVRTVNAIQRRCGCGEVRAAREP